MHELTNLKFLNKLSVVHLYLRFRHFGNDCNSKKVKSQSSEMSLATDHERIYTSCIINLF